MKLTEANKKSALFGEQKQNMAKQRHPCMGELPQQQSNSSDSESGGIFFLGQRRPPTAGAHVERGEASTSARTHVLHHKDDSSLRERIARSCLMDRNNKIQWPPHMENFFPGKDEPSRNSDRWSVDDAEKMPKVVGFFCRDACVLACLEKQIDAWHNASHSHLFCQLNAHCILYIDQKYSIVVQICTVLHYYTASAYR
uniref:Uncharacterized protein n=1 Tax=Oryza meridionalis TaxID=40149 RepID=A0A0E0ENM8_9ORYZ